jgi:hypothetical protein
MGSPLVRRAHNATNALHSLIYFAPETEERLVATGLEARPRRAGAAGTRRRSD